MIELPLEVRIRVNESIVIALTVPIFSISNYDFEIPVEFRIIIIRPSNKLPYTIKLDNLIIRRKEVYKLKEILEAKLTNLITKCKDWYSGTQRINTILLEIEEKFEVSKLKEAIND